MESIMTVFFLSKEGVGLCTTPAVNGEAISSSIKSMPMNP